jgi:signal transduction histidine kinase
MAVVGHVVGQGDRWAASAAVPDEAPGSIRGWAARVRAFLPRGNTLDEETFGRRHLLLCWILGLHVPGLFAFGVWLDVGPQHAALEVVVPAACLVFARLGREHRRLSSFFVAAGLVYCSSVLVHLSYGSIEAHFHFFILIGLIALYQDWVPFLWNAVFTVVSHGIGGTLDPERMYNHAAGQHRPWVWALIHGVSVLAACIGVLVFWRSNENVQGRALRLADDLANSELGKVQVEADRRRAMSQLLVNLARRNQSLLNRQLSLLAELEQREVEPDALASLFQLDHVATRIRRNAESLLVLSGDEPPRRWGRPVPLPEVVRAAAAEVEDYRRVEIMVDERLEVAGRAVADLAHLLAELIENATMFSPPKSPVRVRSHMAPSTTPAHVISIEDTGIGMSEANRQAANVILASTDDVGTLESRLGFHVVSRLARRYGLQVHLVETPGGGTTALVSLSNDLVSVRPAQPVAVAAGGAALDPATTETPSVPPPPPPPPARPPAGYTPALDPGSLVREAVDVLGPPAAFGAGAPGGEGPPPVFLVTGRQPFPAPPSPRLPLVPRLPAPIPPPGGLPPGRGGISDGVGSPPSGPPIDPHGQRRLPAPLPPGSLQPGGSSGPRGRERGPDALPPGSVPSGEPDARDGRGPTPTSAPASRWSGWPPGPPSPEAVPPGDLPPGVSLASEVRDLDPSASPRPFPSGAPHEASGGDPSWPGSPTSDNEASSETPASPFTTDAAVARSADMSQSDPGSGQAPAPEGPAGSDAAARLTSSSLDEGDPSEAEPPEPLESSGPGPQLTRRVPGEALAAARGQPAPAPEGPRASPPSSDAPASTSGGRDEESAPGATAGRIERTRERARVSAMLSRFQASQRAGRAYTEARSDDRHADDPADTHADEE